ncbi:heavy metal-binding domain-containing protein [Sphingobacterium siyangense]|uniref:heavy metal-binding domain-containing protein n=1 Tax=Sphingobacterium siyangense TaxID=459529 RepID=UPI003DA536F9
MIVTTTNSNFPIAANVVIGTNIFSDIGASYVDFFGGRSNSYKKELRFYSRQLFLKTNYYLSYEF